MCTHFRDLTSAQQQAVAECLAGAAIDVHAKLHARTHVERAFVEVQRYFATRVMQLYFKRDKEHLRRVKHALRDLSREFHTRITEAMPLLLRDSHDTTRPGPTQIEYCRDKQANKASGANANDGCCTSEHFIRSAPTTGNAQGCSSMGRAIETDFSGTQAAETTATCVPGRPARPTGAT